jgi:hypothetical protein
MMNELDFAQFKLASGHEVVCEVLEWTDPAIPDSKEIIIKNVMQIINGQVNESGESIFMFRPFVNFCEGEKEYMVMDMSHVLTVNRPNKHLAAEFMYAVEEMNAIAQDRDDEVAEAEELFAQNLEKNKGRLEASMKRVMSKDGDNVVQFPFMKNKPEDDDIIH